MSMYKLSDPGRRAAERAAAVAAVRWRPSLKWRLSVRVVVLAIALDLALALPARSQMPLPFPAPPTSDVPPIATDARLAGDDSQTRLVIDLSHKIDMRAFTLADPYRVVIEIPQVDFRLPPTTGEQGRGIVKAFRYGLVMSGGSRIVIDLTGPARVTKAFVLDPVDGQPARMVLDLIAVDRETFMRATAIDNHLPRPADALPGLADRGERAADPRPVVVLDPGHGGIDPGAGAVRPTAASTAFDLDSLRCSGARRGGGRRRHRLHPVRQGLRCGGAAPR